MQQRSISLWARSCVCTLMCQVWTGHVAKHVAHANGSKPNISLIEWIANEKQYYFSISANYILDSCKINLFIFFDRIYFIIFSIEFVTVIADLFSRTFIIYFVILFYLLFILVVTYFFVIYLQIFFYNCCNI